MSLDHPAEREDDDLDTLASGPLNEEDILWGVERAMGACEQRATERYVLEAPNDEAARKELVNMCRWWGGAGPGYSYEAKGTGLWLRIENREGLITWDEMIQRVRHPEAVTRPQLTLF